MGVDLELIQPGEPCPVPQVLIQRLADAINAQGTPIDIPLKHHFSHGVYGREAHIPKGALVVGRVHKHANMNVLLSGELTVTTDEGMKRVKAPYLVVSPAGTMRAAYAHEDSVWVTFLGTELTDPDEIKEAFSFERFEEYLAHEQMKQLEAT